MLDAAHAEAERLLSAAPTAGMRAGQDRRTAILTRARAESQAIRSGGDAEAVRLASRMAVGRDAQATQLTPLLLIEEP